MFYLTSNQICDKSWSWKAGNVNIYQRTNTCNLVLFLFFWYSYSRLDLQSFSSSTWWCMTFKTKSRLLSPICSLLGQTSEKTLSTHKVWSSKKKTYPVQPTSSFAFRFCHVWPARLCFLFLPRSSSFLENFQAETGQNSMCCPGTHRTWLSIWVCPHWVSVLLLILVSTRGLPLSLAYLLPLLLKRWL